MMVDHLFFLHQFTEPSFITSFLPGALLPRLPSLRLSQIKVLHFYPGQALSSPAPFMYSSCVVVSMVGGGFLIFLPLYPSFLCHNPLLGRIPWKKQN